MPRRPSSTRSPPGSASTTGCDAVRGHLAELRGDRASARRHYLDAARRTTNLAEQHHLTTRAAGLAGAG